MKNQFLPRLITHFVVIGCAFLPLSVQAQEKSSQLSKTDKAFVSEAYQGGLAEVKIGELAQTKATKPEAKTLAGRLISDHQKANEELKKLAESKGLTVPSEPSSAEQATYKLMEKKDGAEFDKAFAKNAVKDHKKDIAEFEKVAKETKDADLKAFIEKTLPVLKEHLMLAQAAEGKE